MLGERGMGIGGVGGGREGGRTFCLLDVVAATWLGVVGGRSRHG